MTGDYCTCYTGPWYGINPPPQCAYHQRSVWNNVLVGITRQVFTPPLAADDIAKRVVELLQAKSETPEKRPPYGETGAPFVLETARRLLEDTCTKPADQVSSDALWVELRLACDEVARLRDLITSMGGTP